MKIEVKWLNDKWKSFSPTCSHFSAGILEIVDLVNDELAPLLQKGQEVKWRMSNNKFVIQIQDVQKKLSKSNE